MCEEWRDRKRETERERERRCQFKKGREKMTDVAGGKERSVWERQPLRDCALNPLPRLNPPPPPSLPVCFAMVTRQGSQCSQLMCFSAAGASWVLMCLSLSPAQSMSTVLGCTNTWRAESQGTLSHPGPVSGREAQRGPRHFHFTFIRHLKTAACSASLSWQKKMWQGGSFIYVSPDITCWSLIHWSEMFISYSADWVSRNVAHAADVPQKLIMFLKFLLCPRQYLLDWQQNKFSPLSEFYCQIFSSSKTEQSTNHSSI